MNSASSSAFASPRGRSEADSRTRVRARRPSLALEASDLLPIIDTILPGLAERAASLVPLVPELPPVDPRAAELSHLLIAANPIPAAALVRTLYAHAESLGGLCATVFEPAARGLGDLWDADQCSQFDVTLGLVRLETTLRELTANARPLAFGLPAVLVAPLPGEIHLLGASLDADLLWRAGWDSHSEFPDTDDALLAMVSKTWFDALDLSLSAALLREGSMAHMTETIARARRASLNPALVVVVGGRAFFEHREAGDHVGADACSDSALRIDASITNAMRRR